MGGYVFGLLRLAIIPYMKTSQLTTAECLSIHTNQLISIPMKENLTPIKVTSTAMKAKSIPIKLNSIPIQLIYTLTSNTESLPFKQKKNLKKAPQLLCTECKTTTL